MLFSSQSMARILNSFSVCSSINTELRGRGTWQLGPGCLQICSAHPLPVVLLRFVRTNALLVLLVAAWRKRWRSILVIFMPSAVDIVYASKIPLLQHAYQQCLEQWQRQQQQLASYCVAPQCLRQALC
ncbi:hypothetical protein FVE85_4121 [Porphyridium purpureum]|uniref:Uncharacterized protein n=1 Tax=Porphyridium purpureum TaxID=35688 RepID=A0A5J4YS42_PORPP|nr:hypothetical protein FVE85_4121 [Porphyridium purpureum]|eukprot:POR0359..scf229_5